MSAYTGNIFNFSRDLPEPFDTLSNKKVKVTSKYSDGATASTLCSTVIKAINAICRCKNSTGEGAVGIIDQKTVAEYKSSTHDEYYAANDALRKVKTHTKVKTDRRDRVYYFGHCDRRLRKTFGSDEYYSCATPLYIKGASCTGLKWSRTAIEEVVLSTYKRQIHLISEQYEEEKTKQKPSVIPALKSKHKSISIQIKGISGEVASLYEKYRSDKISRDEFVRKKQLLAEEKEKLQSDLSIVEADIENAANEERKEAENLQAMEQIVALTEIDDELLASRMYDDIEMIVVRDNNSLDIKWKFDVDYSNSYP